MADGDVWEGGVKKDARWFTARKSGDQKYDIVSNGEPRAQGMLSSPLSYKPDPTLENHHSHFRTKKPFSPFIMKTRRSCRILGAVLALVVLHFLLFSLYSLSHEQSFSGETSLSVSRELLSSSFASFSTSINKISGSKKQKKKKVMEPSLRKAPPSIPNPTQNK
ncbi:hypothetical protein JHK86_007480 [Glycine max]|nr:hypothetical protein JHK86_007480 [Glycine max]